MLRTVTFTAALALAGALALPAAAQSWGFGVQVGPPIYYEEPPVYYGPPVIYEAPPAYYEAPPVVVRPAEPRVFHMEAPELVLDRLERAGYRELSPMARRGTLYRLNAVDPDGNLVALEISIFDGEIERKHILETAIRAPARVVAAPRSAPAVAAPPPAPVAARPPLPKPAPAAVASQPSAALANPPVPLRDRLPATPAEPEEAEEPAGEGPDPLVVY